MAKKTWGGRFTQETDSFANSFNSSIGFDGRLYAHDIDGSIAHCRMLANQGILDEEESSKIIEALGRIKRMIERGEISLEEEDHEDIHSLVESVLVREVGQAGEKLHSGRSRNDQVALDVRMYVREAILRVIRHIEKVQHALVSLAEENFGLIMPGYTHLQRAQPVLLAHHLLAYYEMLERVNVLPLGSAALAGTTFNLDRKMVADELGFQSISENSMDAVSDRDFVLEYLFDASLLMMHLSRLSEELIIWSSMEFGFVSISDSFSTGSSIMPQKKNPDIPELVRGKTGRVYGNLMSLLTTMKGLPLTYNKDMQEDKEALFDTADTVEGCTEIMGRLLGKVSFNADRLREAAEEGFLVATDLADYLVGKGMTFREAHEKAGKIVVHAMEQGKELCELSLREMNVIARVIEEDVYEWLDTSASVERRNILGGTGHKAVRAALKKAKQELKI